MPCQQVVRDVYIAESIFPDAMPQVSFVLPGARAVIRPPRESGPRHFAEVELTSTIEQLPFGPQSHNIPGVVNHGAAVRHVLERTGHAMTRFRGWRSTMTYPVTWSRCCGGCRTRRSGFLTRGDSGTVARCGLTSRWS
jgi:hypothetical protein